MGTVRFPDDLAPGFPLVEQDQSSLSDEEMFISNTEQALQEINAPLSH